MPVQLTRFALSTKDLSRLSEATLRYFVLASHIVNELATLQKILVGCMQATPKTPIGKEGYAAQNLVVAKILAGKLREARQALDRYYFSGPSQELDGELPEVAARALKQITSYFAGGNPISIVRNEAAFHYDGESILATLRKTPEDG